MSLNTVCCVTSVGDRPTRKMPSMRIAHAIADMRVSVRLMGQSLRLCEGLIEVAHCRGIASLARFQTFETCVPNNRTA